MALVMLAFNTGLQGIAGNFAGGKSGAAVDQFMCQVGIGGDAGLRPQQGGTVGQCSMLACGLLLVEHAGNSIRQASIAPSLIVFMV